MSLLYSDTIITRDSGTDLGNVMAEGHCFIDFNYTKVFDAISSFQKMRCLVYTFNFVYFF